LTSLLNFYLTELHAIQTARKINTFWAKNQTPWKLFSRTINILLLISRKYFKTRPQQCLSTFEYRPTKLAKREKSPIFQRQFSGCPHNKIWSCPTIYPAGRTPVTLLVITEIPKSLAPEKNYKNKRDSPSKKQKP